MSDFGQFVGFVLVGTISALVTLSTRALLNQVVVFEIAVAISQVVGLMIAFTLNRLFVFTGFKGRLSVAYGRFVIINLFSLGLATLVSGVAYRSMLFFIGPLPYGDYLAHIIGLGACAFPSYLGHRFYSFKLAARW